VLGQAEQQTAAILSKTGGAGLLGTALLGAAGAGAAAGATKFKTAYDKARDALSRGTKDWKKYGDEARAALAGINVAAPAVAKSIMTWKGSLQSVLPAFAAVSGAVTLFLSTMDKITARFDALDTMAQKLGVTNQRMQELQYIADRSDVSIESIQTAFRTLSTQTIDAAQGLKEPIKFFSLLGISIEDIKKKQPDEIFDDVIEALRKLGPGTMQNAIGMKLLGRGFQDLIPLMNTSKGGMKALAAEAAKLGIILSDEMVAALKDTSERFVTMGAVWKATQGRMADDLGNTTDAWIKGLQDMMGVFKDVVVFIGRAWMSMVELLKVSLLTLPEIGRASCRERV
jgi:hypothetical protein